MEEMRPNLQFGVKKGWILMNLIKKISRMTQCL